MLQTSLPLACETGDYCAGALIAGKYRLERLLGEGGQACVWQAKNLALDVGVAIKFVTLGPGNGPQIARLLLEARTAARLRHPGIVRVFDFGQTESGDSFLVMELLEGKSLADTLACSGRLTPEQALGVLLPIAEALGAAHERGIVHRDVKPDNIFIANFGQEQQPKLLDFGVAKVGDTLTPQTHLTNAGSVVGSPAYLSPEQARGEVDIDHRADVWAFAATLYQCVTGRLPFWQDTYNALLWSIVEDEPVSTLKLGVGDAELWEIIRRGLAKDKSERWESMLVFGRALAAWLVSHGVNDDVSGIMLQNRWLAPRSPSVQTPAIVQTRLSEQESGARTKVKARREGLKASPRRRLSRSESEESHSPLSRSIAASGVELRSRTPKGVFAAVALGLVGAAMLFLAPKVSNSADTAPALGSELEASASRTLTVASPKLSVVREAVAPPRVTVAAAEPEAATSAPSARPVPPAPRAMPAPAPRPVDAHAPSASPLRPRETLTPSRKRFAARSNPDAELMNPY